MKDYVGFAENKFLFRLSFLLYLCILPLFVFWWSARGKNLNQQNSIIGCLISVVDILEMTVWQHLLWARML